MALLGGLMWSDKFLRAKILLGVLFATLSSTSLAQTGKQNVENLRVWHSPERTRIVFDVSSNIEYRTFKLDEPKRLVIDLQKINLSVSLPKVEEGNRHLADVRSGSPSKNVLRVVFDLKADVTVSSFLLTPNELYGHRLVVDLYDEKSSKAVDTAYSVQQDSDLTEQTQTGSNESFEPTAVQVAPVKRDERFIVAVDAGHGGDDPGAIGYRGTKEKQLTLSISKELVKRINKNPKMKAVLVRTGDYYLALQDRRNKAKKNINADVFISIHADAFTKRSARGMSVFALSQRGATSTMAATLAAKENASDLIGGVSLSNKDEVLRKVLVDLSMTNTISESVNLGGRVLKELGKLGHLHSKRVEQANFSVLRTPDVPSILVETGFITNPDDERRLRTKSYQIKLANAVYEAVNEYYQQTPYASSSRYDSPTIANSQRSGSESQKQKITYGRHKVVRGDTLSDIAAKYGISLRELKRLNKLKHNTAMLGVRLKVPVSVAQIQSPAKKASVTASTGTSKMVHKVRSGDSLSKISARYNVTINAIKRANGLKSNTLRKGQSLTIPGVSAAAKTLKHTVKRGDTLSEIAQQYGSTVAKIKRANKLRSNTVRLGQVLSVPQ